MVWPCSKGTLTDSLANRMSEPLAGVATGPRDPLAIWASALQCRRVLPLRLRERAQYQVATRGMRAHGWTWEIGSLILIGTRSQQALMPGDRFV